MSNLPRLTIDYTNTELINQMTTFNVKNTTPICENSSDYLLIVEKLECPLSLAPLYTDTREFKILVDVKDAANIPVGMAKGYNLLTIPHKIHYSIDDFIYHINKTLATLFGVYQIPQFGFDYDNNKCKFTIMNPDQANLNLFDIFLDQRLKRIFDYFNYPGSLMYMGSPYYQIQIANIVGTTYQYKSTLNRFYKFKSIRVYSRTLPLGTYKVYNQNLDSMVNTDMITEIVINSAEFDPAQENILLMPFYQKLIELTGNKEIKDFDIYFKIHYTTGPDHLLTMSPEEYASITMLFEKISFLRRPLVENEN